MIRRIRTLKALPELQLLASFDDGRTVVYDVSDDVRNIPSYTVLAEVPGLFAQARLDESRTCVFWNDEVDLPSDAIYEYGSEVAPA